MMRWRLGLAASLAGLLLPLSMHAQDRPRTAPAAAAPNPPLIREVDTTELLRGFTISSDLRTLAGSDGKTLFLWDGQKGALRRKIALKALGINELVFAPDGAMLAAVVVRDGYEVMVLDARTGVVRRRWESESSPHAVTFSPNGQSLAYASWDGVYLVDLGTGARRKLELRSIDGLAFSPDGATLAAASEASVLLVDTATLKSTRTLPLDLPMRDLDRPGRTERVVFSPDGKLLAASPTTDGKGLIRIFDLETGELRRGFVAHDEAVVHLLFTKDAEMLITTTAIPDEAVAGVLNLPAAAMRIRSEVSFWDLSTGKRLRKLVGNELGPGAMLHPDGKTLITYDALEGTPIQLWDVRTGAEFKRPVVPPPPRTPVPRTKPSRPRTIRSRMKAGIVGR